MNRSIQLWPVPSKLWLAQLLRPGLFSTGYMYPKAERAVRDMLRTRSQLVGHKTMRGECIATDQEIVDVMLMEGTSEGFEIVERSGSAVFLRHSRSAANRSHVVYST